MAKQMTREENERQVAEMIKKRTEERMRAGQRGKPVEVGKRAYTPKKSASKKK